MAKRLRERLGPIIHKPHNARNPALSHHKFKEGERLTVGRVLIE